MEFLVGLSKFVKRIRKNKIYRLASYIIKINHNAMSRSQPEVVLPC